MKFLGNLFSCTKRRPVPQYQVPLKIQSKIKQKKLTDNCLSQTQQQSQSYEKIFREDNFFNQICFHQRELNLISQSKTQSLISQTPQIKEFLIISDDDAINNIKNNNIEDMDNQKSQRILTKQEELEKQLTESFQEEINFDRIIESSLNCLKKYQQTLEEYNEIDMNELNNQMKRFQLELKCQEESKPLNSQQIENKVKKIKEIYDNLLNYLELKKGKEDEDMFPIPKFDDLMNIFKQYNCQNLNQIIVEHTHISEKISVKNIKTLKNTNWLNDEIINGYSRLIMKHNEESSQFPKIKITNSFFYPEVAKGNLNQFQKVLRISQRQNINFSYAKIFIPINNNSNHWIFCEIDIEHKKIILYNSLYSKKLFSILNNIENYINALAINLNQPTSGWDCQLSQDYPQQKNGSDCGVFTLKGIHYRARGKQCTFKQKDIPYFRVLIATELIQGHLLN